MTCNLNLTLCTVWAVTGAAFIMGLPLLQGPTAVLATTSIATVGLAECYGLPIGLHVLASHRFEAGPFTLGRYVINQVLMSVLKASGKFNTFSKAEHKWLILVPSDLAFCCMHEGVTMQIKCYR